MKVRRPSRGEINDAVKSRVKESSLEIDRCSDHSLRDRLPISSSEAKTDMQANIHAHTRHKSVSIEMRYAKCRTLFANNLSVQVGL